jgi:hypothetical protein
MKYCKICGNIISIRTKTYKCHSCAAKEFIKIKGSSGYIDGRTLKKYYCIICNNQINWQTYLYGTKKCRLHYKKGLPKCIDCGKELSRYGAKRCKKCIGKTKKINYYCKDCGKKISWRKNRCRHCYIRFNKGKNNPMYGRVTHTKPIKYKDIFFHSSWEVKYAEYLDQHKNNWFYEYKTFNMGHTTYTPDFYLPETNEYIEIKGYWRRDALNKFFAFKLLYPEIKIKVLEKKDLEYLKILKRR